VSRSKEKTLMRPRRPGSAGAWMWENTCGRAGQVGGRGSGGGGGGHGCAGDAAERGAAAAAAAGPGPIVAPACAPPARGTSAPRGWSWCRPW
jgi:hypothetical protein